MPMKKGGLGKGLSALFSDNDLEEKKSVMLGVSEMEPNHNQPRSDFDEDALSELADSIARHGVLQPLLVRPISEENRYQIVAGERRWRASKMAGLLEVPVIIREFTDQEVLEVALIENLQREDLSPIEEALGYKALIDTYNFTQDEVAKSVGKSRSTITNVLRLLNLPESVLNMISDGRITAGHARPLLTLKNPEDIEKIAKMIIDQNLSVRDVEKFCRNLLKTKDQKLPKINVKRNPFFDEIEVSLKEVLGRRIKVKNKSSKDEGTLEIEFYNNDDLANIAKCLGDYSI